MAIRKLKIIYVAHVILPPDSAGLGEQRWGEEEGGLLAAGLPATTPG